MSQLIQIILILIYLIIIFIFTNHDTYTLKINSIKIHPILVALISICFGIFISLLALIDYKSYLKYQISKKSEKEKETETETEHVKSFNN